MGDVPEPFHRFPPLEPVAAARAATRTRRQQQYLEQTAAAAIAGTPAQVERRLAELFDRAALAASDEALAALFGRSRPLSLRSTGGP